MKLYKVVSTSNCDEDKFIIALDKSKAIVKYYELVKVFDSENVTANYLCNYNELIPTLKE